MFCNIIENLPNTKYNGSIDNRDWGVLYMSIIWEEQLLLENEGNQKSSINEILNKLDLENFKKFALPTYESETFSDINLKVKQFVPIEEYMDMFCDWAYGILFEDLPQELQYQLSKGGDNVIQKLFNYYIQTEEHRDYLKDLMQDPSVKDQISEMSKEVEQEYDEENKKYEK